MAKQSKAGKGSDGKSGKAGKGPDGEVEGTNGNDVIIPNFVDADGDIVDGSDGINDLIFGLGGDDYIHGGAGNDVIRGDSQSTSGKGGKGGKAGDDGDDTIYGGAGADTIYGDGGDDVIRVDEIGDGYRDVVFGGGPGSGSGKSGKAGKAGKAGDDSDNDTLDLTGSTGPGVHAEITHQEVDSDGNGFDGTVSWTDADGNVLGTLEFENIENIIIPCFVRSTVIKCKHGNIPVEDIRVGDKIATADNGYQTVRWVGSTTVPAMGKLAPITFRKGALGNTRDLKVSPQHRMLVTGWKVELLFGEAEGLVPAKSLVNGDTIFWSNGGTVEYFHIMFDQHELIWAEGILSESFYPDSMFVEYFHRETLSEFKELFPERGKSGTPAQDFVRPILRATEARAFSQ